MRNRVFIPLLLIEIAFIAVTIYYAIRIFGETGTVQPDLQFIFLGEGITGVFSRYNDLAFSEYRLWHRIDWAHLFFVGLFVIAALKRVEAKDALPLGLALIIYELIENLFIGQVLANWPEPGMIALAVLSIASLIKWLIIAAVFVKLALGLVKRSKP